MRLWITLFSSPPSFLPLLAMALPANEHGSLSDTGVRIMLARVVLCSLFLACAFTPANALTQEELLTRLEAATADRGGSGLLSRG